MIGDPNTDRNTASTIAIGGAFSHCVTRDHERAKPNSSATEPQVDETNKMQGKNWVEGQIPGELSLAPAPDQRLEP